MQITVNPAQERFIQERLDTGLYDSANALLEEALALLEERDQWFNLDIEHLKPAIAQGVAELEAGLGMDGPVFFEKLLRRSNPQTP
ncbi:MAG: type II toxin-antitoxin system ParD family antitoxin [Candidatus Hydrogenedentes bacterium]|nr:type II toxin-antitoxin system ParD family antitoxin [Candidatus Hydrogenedentota bacterium]